MICSHIWLRNLVYLGPMLTKYILFLQDVKSSPWWLTIGVQWFVGTSLRNTWTCWISTSSWMHHRGVLPTNWWWAPKSSSKCPGNFLWWMLTLPPWLTCRTLPIRYIFFFKMPKLPEFFVRLNDLKMFEASFGKCCTPEEVEAFKYTFAKKGTVINEHQRK